MSGAPPRARRMVSLGKVTAPKPVNLPSQKKENNGNDPTINLVPKGSGTWGDSNVVGSAPEGKEQGDAPKLLPRAIPAAPTAAWGGAGLPEERKRALELASREEFPILTAKNNFPEQRQRSSTAASSEGRQAAWDDDERSYAGPLEDREPHVQRGERWGSPYGDRDRPYGGPPLDRERYGPEWDRYGPPDRGRGPPPDWDRDRDRYDDRYREERYRDGPALYDRERYDDRYGPPPPRGERYGPPPREYGYHDSDYNGPPRRPYDGPPSRGDSDYERDPRRPHPAYDGPYRGREGARYPPRDYDRPAGDYFPRAPPPPPPRRPDQGPESSSLASTPPHANGGPLERSISLQSGSTQLSDSTAASSRRATLGSSMPRSDWGSVAGEVPSVDDHRTVAEDAAKAVGPGPRGEGRELAAGTAAQQQQQQPGKPDVRERPRARAPLHSASGQPLEQQQKAGLGPQMQTLGAASWKRPAPAQRQQQQPLDERPMEQQPPAARPPAEQEQPLPPPQSPSQGAGPTRILRREPQAVAAAAAAAAAPEAAPAIAPPQQQEPQQQEAGTRPPPPPPPRQQGPAPPAASQASLEAASLAQLSLGGQPAAYMQVHAPPLPPQQQRVQQQQQQEAQQQQQQQQHVQRPLFPVGQQQQPQQPIGAGWQQGQAAAGAPDRTQREEGVRTAEDVVLLGGGLSLPSQDSLMHHIASPERQPMLRASPAAQQAAAASAADVGGIARSMLPQAAMPLPPHPPVSVTAQFTPASQQQQQQQLRGQQPQQLLQQHQRQVQMSLAGLGQPGAPLIYAAVPGGLQGVSSAASQQQQQPSMYAPGGFMLPTPQQQQGVPGAAAVHPSMLGLPVPQQQQLLAMQQQLHMQGVPASSAAAPSTSMPQPLMTFGSMSQPMQVSAAAARLPVGGFPLQASQPALQFGNVVLPSAIEGSVDSEVPAEAAQQGQQADLTAEQQHAFMKAKAAEKARLLQEQEMRRKMEEERRSKQKAGERPSQQLLPLPQQQNAQGVGAPPPPPPRAAQPHPRPARGRGRGEGGTQHHGHAQSAAVEEAAGRGKGPAGRGPRGKGPRGGRDAEAAPGTIAPAAVSAQPPPPPPTVVEIRKPAKQQKPRPPRAAGGTTGSAAPPPGLAHAEGGSTKPAGAPGPATATVVVVERPKRIGGGGKQGSGGGKLAPAPGLSRQASRPHADPAAAPAGAAEANGTAEAASENGNAGKRSGRSRGGRGGKAGGAASETVPSNSAPEAGEGSKGSSRPGKGRGRGGRGGGGGGGGGTGSRPAEARGPVETA